jgi:hypothetical protein
MRGRREAIAVLLLAMLAACSSSDDPGTFSGPVLQRTAIKPGVLARAYAQPRLARRTVYVTSPTVARFWKGQSTCPWVGG